MCLEIEQRDDLLAILGNLRQRYERVAAEQPRLSDVLERFGGTGLIQAVVVSDLGGRSETREHYYGLLGYEPAGQVEWHVDKWDPEGNRLAILEAIDISSGLGHRFDMLFEH
jgi:hypothetical protein